MITHVYQHIQINIQTRQAKNIKGGGQKYRGANSIRCTCLEHDFHRETDHWR